MGRRLLLGFLLLLPCAAEAQGQPQPGRWSLEVRGGELLNATGEAGLLLRKDTAPGNLIILVKHQGVGSLRGAYEAKPGLEVSLEFSTAGLEVAAQDLVASPGIRPFVSGQVRMARIGLWVNDGIFEPHRTPFFSPGSPDRWRWSVGLLAGRLEATGVSLVEEGRAFAGIESVVPAPETVFGFGARVEFKLGSSGWTLGAESTMSWASGHLLTVKTRPGSTYQGADIKHGPAQFLLGLGYHF